MDRLDRVITAAGDLGMVVLLNVFYHGQEQRLTDEAAVVRATDNVTDWLLAKGHTNVLVIIIGEASHSLVDHDILKEARVGELIGRVQSRSGGQLLASTGLTGRRVPNNSLIATSDFVVLHGNGANADGIRNMVATTRSRSAFQTYPKPIFFTEDSTKIANFDAAVEVGASWGYHDKDGFQIVPIDWRINTSNKLAFFTRVTELSEVTPPPPDPTTYELRVSQSPDRSSAQLLDGATVAGDVAVFSVPESGVSQVRFLLDGVLHRTENNPPFDFDGGSVSAATLFATDSLADGPHTITAEIDDGFGTTTVVASFTAANTMPALLATPPSLALSAPEGESATGAATVTASDGAAIAVDVSDDAGWLTVTPAAGSTPLALDLSADGAGLAAGNHVGTVTVTDPGGSHLPAVLTVTFDVTSPSLRFAPASVAWAVEEGESAARAVTVEAVDGAAVAVDVSDDAGWLNATPVAGTTPLAVSLAADTTGLVPGSYSATVSATDAAGVYAGATLPVQLTVTAPLSYELMVSYSSDRSDPNVLDGASVAGDIAVFALPEAGVTRVRFFLDGVLHRTENSAPFDFDGGSVTAANLYATDGLTDGTHSITAEIDAAAGTSMIAATFTVANTAPLLVASPPSVMMSVFEGGVGSATSDVTAGDGAAVGIGVADDASWLTVAPASGTTPLTLDLTADSTGLAAGTHSATVTVTDPAGIHVSTTIAVNLQVTTPGPPDQIHLSWVEDPATSFTVVWRTPLVGTPSVVEYRTAGAPTWSSSTGTVRPSGTSGMLHEATVTGLVPDTKYEYRVRGTAGSWSGVRATRTAPAPGPADFDVVFVADTGLIGRIDGLATGTAQVRDEIAALDPRLVLGGGDYAYFSTETRFATLDEAIDEWFEQWSTVIDRTPFMPTYGNHEVLLGESYQSWADRFATPDGFNGRRFYSFDIGETHFISMLAVAEQQGLSSPELEWIEDDIIAAQAAGQRWIIPFFHVAAFADGGNHPSNLQLRNQLGPLFEQYGVQLVLFAHDQSYERTYPLTDVPATNSPTSTSTVCYDAGDGAVWMKSGPGGKLSNKNADFSQWLTTPSPPWTAFRDNTRHHFSRLTFSALGSLRVETYGVTGDGGPPVIQDSFEITSGSYPGNLVATPTALEFTVSEGDGDAADITVTASDGSSVGFAATANEPWLAVTPASGPTPGTVAVSVDTAGLVPGTHTGAVAVSDPTGTFDPTTVPVQLTVIGAGPAYDLLMSSSSDRSDPASLDGAAVAGDIAVFTAPDAGVGQVRFFLDETQHRTEKNAPFDFNGGSVGAAKLYATTELDDGLHTITAELDDASGTTTVQAVFTGANTSPVLSFTPATVGFSVLEGETSADSVSLTSSSGASVGVEVTDDASWLSVAPVAGTTPMVLDLAVDTTGLVLGRHTAAVTATDPGGVHVPGTLTVTVDVVEQALRSVPSTLTFSVPEGGAAAQDVTIETTDGTGVDFGTTTSDSWLVASPVSGSTPQSVTVSVEASGLGVGTHHGSIVATDPGGIYDPVTVPVQLTVTAPTIYQLLVSGSPDRSVPTALEGATVAGDIFVFVEPTAGVGHVDFWINDPGRVSRRDKRESNPPFDLAGTAGGPARFANPYDSAQLGNGANTVSIEVNLDDGSTVVVDASFTVSNG